MLSIIHNKLKLHTNSKTLAFIYIGLYLINLYFFKHHAIVYLAGSLILIELFQAHKWKILFLINIYALVFDKLATQVKAHFKYEPVDVLRVTLGGYIDTDFPTRGYILAALLIFMIFIGVFFYVLKKYKLKFEPIWAILLTLLLWHFLGQKQLLGPLGVIVGILLLHSIFFLVYEFSNYEACSFKTYLQRVTLAFPFWHLASVPIMPILMGTQYANRVEVEDENHKNELKFRAVSQIFILLCIKFFVNTALAFLVGSGVILYITNSGPGKILNSNLGHSAWFSLVAHYIDFIFNEVVVEAGAIVTMLWMLGYNVANNTNRIDKSQTITDLMQRLYFYYNQILQTVFIIPIYSALRSILKNKKITWFLSVFLGVFAGGMCFAIMRTALFVRVSSDNYWSLLGSRVLYFLFLAIALAFSSLKLFRIKDGVHWCKRIILTFFVFAIYFLIFVTGIKSYRLDFEDRLSFLARLFRFF